MVHLVRRFYEEMWNRFDRDLVRELLTEHVQFRGSLGREAVGHEGFREYMEYVRAAFPDFTNEIEQTLVEGDRLFARLTYRGTHRGELFGIPPTGRKVEYAGAALFRFRSGRIAQVWVLGDIHGLMRQLGQ